MASDPSSGNGPARSLEDVHASVPIPKARWRRLLAFAGPAYLVSVGYMDPGNWATDLEGGARFGYRADLGPPDVEPDGVLLQTLAARLGVVTGHDLAQACRRELSAPAQPGPLAACRGGDRRDATWRRFWAPSSP